LGARSVRSRIRGDVRARAGAKFFSLPEIHPSYIGEVVTTIHELQEKLLMRPTYRRCLEEAGA